MLKHYFKIIQGLTLVGNLSIFLYFSHSIDWQLDILDWFLGIVLANAPILLYTPWFRQMALDLRSSWANLFSYLSPAIAGFGGLLTYLIMIKLGNFGFWLYFLVPFGQAVVFNILLAFAMQAALWCSEVHVNGNGPEA